jgi:hypothetical protein
MRKLTLILSLILVTLCGFYTSTRAEGDASAVIKIKRCQDFEVTGTGDSPNWNLTEWIDIPLRNNAGEKYNTRSKVLYSENGLYFLFDCQDKKLTSTLKGDYLNLYDEDVVEVFLWPSEDFPVYFEYELSPFNYELPIMVPNYNGKFFGWLPWQYTGDKKTRHATSVSGGKPESGAAVSGWKAEFFVPFKLLNPLPKVPAISGTKWRANLYRIDYDGGKGGSYAWQKTQKNFHDYKSFGTFIFE